MILYTVWSSPEPTIDVEAAARTIILGTGEIGDRSGRDGSWPARDSLKALLAQAWEEGRWSPPGACMNPYGQPAARPNADQQGFPGLRLLHLRQAAQAALAWIENMAPTVRRTALAEQLRSALGGNGEK
jgi:hypothetical protein